MQNKVTVLNLFWLRLLFYSLYFTKVIRLCSTRKSAATAQPNFHSYSYHIERQPEYNIGVSVFNPNQHEGRYFYLLYNYTHSTFSSILMSLPRGVMDKAVDSGSEGPWFDPCLRHIFFHFFILCTYIFSKQFIKVRQFNL